MLATLMAMLFLQVPTNAPVARQVPQQPIAATVAQRVQMDRLIAEARALLARAQSVKISYGRTAGQPTEKDFSEAMEAVQSDLDSMSQTNESEQMRMQMAANRMTKSMAALSNMLKRISETRDSVARKIKD